MESLYKMGLSNPSIKMYNREAKLYLEISSACGQTFLSMEEYRRVLIKKSYATSTINRKLASVKRLFNYIKMSDTGVTGLIADIYYQTPMNRTSPLSRDDFMMLRTMDLLDHVPTDTLRDIVITNIIIETGMKPTDIAELRLTDTFPNTTLRFGRAFNDYVSRLTALPRSMKDSELLFLNNRNRKLTRQGVWFIIKRHGERIGISAKVTPRILAASGKKYNSTNV